MRIHIYYGGRGLLDDPTLYVISKMEEVLKELKNNTSIIKDSVGVFQYSINDKKIEIKINPPIQTIVEGAN